MGSRRRTCALWFVLAACGGERAGDVELEPRCDGDGAVALLELGAHEAVGTVRRFDDSRLWVSITDAPSGERSRALLVSDCGGHEEAVASNLAQVFLLDDVLLGCDEAYRLVQPADLQDAAPVVLAERGCANRRTDHGLVAYDSPPGAETGRIVVIRHDGGGALAVSTLLDGVRMPEAAIGFPAVVEGEAFAMTPDDALWQVNVATGESALVREGVVESQVSRRYVLYRRVDPIPDGYAAVVLYDRETGDEAVLDEAFPASVMIQLGDDAAVLGWNRLPEPLWFSLSDAQRIIPPPGMRIVSEGSEGLGLFWLAGDAGYRTELLRWRDGGVPEPAMTCLECAPYPRLDLGGLQVIVDMPGAPRTLWFVDDAGGPAARLAAPIGEQYLQLADRRVLTMLDDDAAGGLVLYGEGEGRTVAEGVLPSAVFLTSVFDGDSDRDVLYEVDDGDEHTLYFARLAEVR